MNRRSFFGAAAGVAAAAPALAAVPGFPGGGLVGKAGMQTLGFAFDAKPITEALEPLKYAVGAARSFQFDPGLMRRPGRDDRYVYRTGYPSIDALRSVSGVHKARMEARHVEGNSQ